MSFHEELDRIKSFYGGKYWSEDFDQRFSLFSETNLYMQQARDRAILRALKKAGKSNLAEQKIVEFCCGRGTELSNFIRYGAISKNLYGVDLMDNRIEYANKNNPAINYFCGDASARIYEPGTFDIAIQIMGFSSILSDDLKMAMACEMMSCIKTNGVIIWVDFIYTNPLKKTRDVKGIGKSEIYRLFEGCDVELSRAVLARPAVKILSKISIAFCGIFDLIPFLNNFYIGIFKKIN